RLMFATNHSARGSTSLVGGANAAITALQHPEDCRMMHAVEFGDGSGAIACSKPLAGLLLLMGRQFGLAAELDALGSGNPSAVVGPLDDPLPLVLGHGAEEGDEPAADRRGEIQVRLVQHLDQGTALVEAVDDPDAIEHAAGGTVPFGNDQYIA